MTKKQEKQEITRIKRQHARAKATLDLSYFLEGLQRKYKLTNIETILILQHESNVALASLNAGHKKGSHIPRD